MPQVGSNKTEVARTGRVQNDEEPKNNIKLDYSETYHENDQLEFLLENKLTHLHKAKFRSGIEREASFKVARKAAENIQSLSEAIRQGSIPSSVTLYKQDPARRRSSGTRQDVEQITDCMKELTTTNNDHEQKQKLQATMGADGSSKPKPTVNTLTMFALSLHKMHSNIGIGRSSESVPQIMKQRAYSAKSLPNTSPSKSRNMSRFRSAKFARQRLKDVAALDVIGSVPATNYGSDEYKKKTKSRRQLQELSKIEQRSIFDTPNKPEDRRRRLYEWAKGDPKALDGRIQSFISDIEDFKRRNTHPDIKVDPSLFTNNPSYAY